jgi:hypothetical protein
MGDRRTEKLLMAAAALLVLAAGITLVIAKNQPTPAAGVKKQLSDSLQTGVGRKDGLEVNFDSKTGLAKVVQTDRVGIHGPSAQEVRTAYVLLVKLGNEMFKNENVKSIQITEKTKFEYPEDPADLNLPKDARSTRPPIITDVVTIGMTRANFKSVNWSQYYGKPIHKLITEKSYTYSINPKLEQQPVEKELYLDLQAP